MQTEQGNDSLRRFHAGARNQIVRKVTKKPFNGYLEVIGPSVNGLQGEEKSLSLVTSCKETNHSYTLPFKNMQVRFHCIPELQV